GRGRYGAAARFPRDPVPGGGSDRVRCRCPAVPRNLPGTRGWGCAPNGQNRSVVAELDAVAGSAVVVVDDRSCGTFPVAAFPVLRNVAVVFAGETVPNDVCAVLGAAQPAPDAMELVRRAG